MARVLGVLKIINWALTRILKWLGKFDNNTDIELVDDDLVPPKIVLNPHCIVSVVKPVIVQSVTLLKPYIE